MRPMNASRLPSGENIGSLAVVVRRRQAAGCVPLATIEQPHLRVGPVRAVVVVDRVDGGRARPARSARRRPIAACRCRRPAGRSCWAAAAGRPRAQRRTPAATAAATSVRLDAVVMMSSLPGESNGELGLAAGTRRLNPAERVGERVVTRPPPYCACRLRRVQHVEQLRHQIELGARQSGSPCSPACPAG